MFNGTRCEALRNRTAALALDGKARLLSRSFMPWETLSCGRDWKVENAQSQLGRHNAPEPRAPTFFSSTGDLPQTPGFEAARQNHVGGVSMVLWLLEQRVYEQDSRVS